MVSASRWMMAGALVTLLGCAAAPRRTPAVPSSADDAKLDRGPSEGDLSEPDKELFDLNRLSVTDAKTDTVYTIRDGKGAVVTENEFVRRYRTLVGGELNDYERNHALGARVGWTTLAAAGVGMIVGGLALTVSDQGNCASSTNVGTTAGGSPNCGLGSAGIAGATVAGIGFLATTAGTIGLALAFRTSDYDGSPAEHFLGARDAQPYIDRYNRALLRKIVQDAKDGSQGSSSLAPPHTTAITLAPVVSPTFTGVVGQF